MRGTSGNSSGASLDAKMAQVVDALDKFEAALSQATQAVQNGSPSSTVAAALGAAQNASFGVTGAAGGNASTTTSAALSGSGGAASVPGAPGLLNNGGSGGALVQGSANVPFAGGQPTSGGGGYLFQPVSNPGGGGIAYPLAGPDRRNAQTLGWGSHLAGQAISYADGIAANGGDDPYGRASMVATSISAAIGIGVSAFATPAAGAIAFGASEAVLGPLAHYIASPEASRQQSSQSLRPFFGAYAGGAAGDWNTYFNGTGGGTPGNAASIHPGSAVSSSQSRFVRMSQYLRENVGLPSELRPDEYGKDVAAVFGGVAAGLFQGGIDPFSAGSMSPFDGGVVSPLEGRRSEFGLNRVAGSSIKNVTAAGVVAGNQIINDSRFRYHPTETLAETYTRRLGTLFGNEAPSVTKDIAPIFGATPETGGNIADVLTRFGAQNTATWLRVTDERVGRDGKEMLGSDLDTNYLSRVGASIRGRGRQAQFASLQARGTGAGLEAAFDGEMSDIASLPGGKDSLAFADARSKRRSATLERYRNEDTTNYELPMTHLRGERDRAEVLPYSPTNIFKLDLQMIGQNKAQIGKLKGRLDSLRSSGDLSEDEELRLNSNIEGLRTENARAVAGLSEGMENRLPALAAGRPRQSMAFNSFQLAALNLQMMNSPVRGSGAVNGRQLKAQDDFVHMLGGDEAEISPRSRTQGMNSNVNHGLEKTLDRLAAVLEKMTGGSAPIKQGGQRNGEAAGQMGGQLSQKDVGQGSYHNTRN